ncbi:MAG: putative membrane protein, partial [Pirellulaceae bacterium]
MHASTKPNQKGAELLTDPFFILFVLGTNIVIAELLSKYTAAKHLGATLLVMIITAVVANLGVIPTSSQDAPIYSGILTYVTPLAIFWLLLRVNLREVLKAGMPMVGLFLLGSIGTAVGVLLAMWIVNGRETIGESYRAIGGVFVGTYTGGGVNFNALAMHYGLNNKGAIFAGITAVDNILTAVWMAATIALPKILERVWPLAKFGIEDESAKEVVDSGSGSVDPITDETDDTESVHPINLGFLLAVGAAGLWISEITASWMKTSLEIELPSIIILTTIALILAQF